jgi:hypothetical protein
MKNLQESFPDMTDFSEQSLNTKAFEELDKWVSKIQENMKGMSGEELERA